MLDKAFEVAVVFSAVDNMTRPMQAMAGQMGVLDERTKALQTRMNGFKNMAFVGGALTLAGGAIAKGLFDAANAAGELQMSLAGVRTALSLNNDEYAKAIKMAQTVGIPTIFSANDVGSIMQTMATSGLNKKQVMDPNILKEYVNFADVQAQIKKENAPDVVGAAVKMAHQYQLYTSSQIAPFLNELNGALLHSSSTADEFGTTYKYISGQARTMGMSSSDTLSTTAWLDRMGLGSGKGGTNFADFLKRSIYGSSGKKADKSMEAAGFVKDGHSVFEDAKGAFVGIPAAVKIMQDFGTRFKGNSNTMSPLLNSIFGAQGARVAMMMTSGGASEQYTNVQKQISGTDNIDKTQGDLNNTWQGKTKQFQTTLADIQQAFGQGVESGFLPFINGLDEILAKILEFEQTHPEIVKWIATFASVAAAALLIVGPILLITGVLGYLSTSGMVTTGFKLMGTAIKGASTPMLLLIATGYLLYQAWKNDWGGIREITKGVVDWIKQEMPKAIKNVKDFAKDLGLIDDKGKLSDVLGWLAKIAAAVYVGKKAYDTMKLAAIAFNLVSSDNPWLLTLALIAAAVMLIVTNWDSVKKAINDATVALRDFFGVTSGGKTPEQQTIQAYTNFNSPNYKPSNPNGTLQPQNPGIIGSIGNALGNFRNWVKGNAAGTDYWSGGLSLVGEKGPEIVNLPRGSQVIPNHRINDYLGGDPYSQVVGMSQSGGGENGGQGASFEKGAITVIAAPGQSADDIAESVMKKISRKFRGQTWSRPTAIVSGVS